MARINYNLPHDDPKNVAAAKKLKLKWSEARNGFVTRAGKLVGRGYSEVNDLNWGTISKREAVFCHK